MLYWSVDFDSGSTIVKQRPNDRNVEGAKERRVSPPGSTRHGLHKGEALGTALAKIAIMNSPRELGVKNETQAVGGRDERNAEVVEV